MKFRTEIQIRKSEKEIDHQSKVLLLGSCFAQNIGQKLRTAKFQSQEISHGILFNPYSVNQALLDVMGNVKYTKEEIHSWNKTFFSFNHQKQKFKSAQKTLETINAGIASDFEFVQDADVILITLGTAWVYRHEKAGLVANCHKLPNQQFTKEKLGVNDIISQFSRTLNHLFLFNPEAHVIFTISPVRHWKDGAIENQWSKATLNLGVHELVRRFDHVSYFPAYELLMDDLRDYRFYKDDLLHPNEMAVNYIWEKFQQSFFSGHTQDGVHMINKWQSSYRHKVLGDENDHIQHYSELLRRAKELEEDFDVNFSAEKQYLQHELNELLKA